MITLFLVRVMCQSEEASIRGLLFFAKRWAGIGLGLGGPPSLIRGPHIQGKAEAIEQEQQDAEPDEQEPTPEGEGQAG